jgi:hypothetical protein
LRANFSTTAGGGTSRWSDSLPTAVFAGLDLKRLQSPGGGPIRFAIVREAGRLDCAGKGGDRRATGQCRFSADPGFTAFLAARGIGRPTANQAFSLMAVNARREIVTALTAARYPAPSVNDLIPMVAIGVDGPYIADLAAAGYRANSLDSLLQFKALGISADFVRSFRALGYRDLRPGDLVQLKALGVTPAYVNALRKRGYGNLSVNRLVQLKALNMTADDLDRGKRSSTSR